MKIHCLSMIPVFLMIFSLPPLHGQDIGPLLKPGDSLPPMVLPDTEGKPSTLEIFRGQKLILHIFASW